MPDTRTQLLCEICANPLQDEDNPVCWRCTETIFETCCECGEPCIIDWNGNVRMDASPVYFAVSMQRHLLREIHNRYSVRTGDRSGLSNGTFGPFLCVANPHDAFGSDFIDAVAMGRTLSNGETACESCGYQCRMCYEWHGTEWDANYCCDESRHCEECDVWHDNELQAERCCGPQNVHDYSFRPTLRFFAGETPNQWTNCALSGPLYMGAELEMENVREHLDGWYLQTCEDFAEPTFTFWKSDGSLSDSGAELVTMPATLDAMRNYFPWDAVETLRLKGARSFGTGSCGMHIHVSRSAFSATHMWRFVKLQTKNVAMCTAIAQRNSNQWARWSANGNVDDSDGTLPDYVKGKDSNCERYVAINFQNQHTVELRYFVGNMVASSILAKFEFVHAMWNYTKDLSVQDVKNGALHSGAFLSWARAHENEYSTFVRFINQRSI